MHPAKVHPAKVTCQTGRAMHTSEAELTPVYTDELANRRFAGVLRRVVLVAAALLTALCTAAAVVSYRLAAERAWDQETEVADMVSQLPLQRAADLIEASGRQAIVVVDGGGRRPLAIAAGDDSRSRRWHARIAAAAARDGRRFTTADPDGADWWHTTVQVDDARALVVGRRVDEAMAPWRGQGLIILALWVLGLLALGGIGAIVFRRIGRPARLLADASDQLRVRGRVADDLRRRLASVGQTPVELRRLVDNFEGLETDLRHGDRQITALLNAGISLGGSLDEQTVLDRTLEHLEHLLGVERTVIIRYDPRIESFEVVASRGHDESFLTELAGRADDPTLPSLRSLRERVPVQVPDTEAEVVAEALRLRGRRHGYRSVLAIPLTEELEHPMVLVLHASGPRTYSYDEVELSKPFVAIAGAALRNAELFQSTDTRLKAQTSRLEAIVGSVEQGILVEDDRGRLLFANPTMRGLLPSPGRYEEGMSAAAFIGAVVGRAASPQAVRAELERLTAGEGWLDVDLRRADLGHVDLGHVDLRRADPADDEEATTYRVRGFAVRDARGNVIGRGQTWRDVSRERELERMKEGLLAAVSHEFRTPLALIKGYASTLLADDVDWNPADQRDFLRMVGSEADRLADLVKRILDMRRIDAGMLTLQPMPVELTALVESVVDALPQERHRIEVAPLPSAVLEVDEARVVTALRNLVENACKYSSFNDPVRVSATLDGADGALGAFGGAGGEGPVGEGPVGEGGPDPDRRVTLRIRDRGPGIPPRLRDAVFETFVRADHGLDAAEGGVGLGLAIAKGFIEAHGGRIWIDEPPDGAPGAVFAVTLPLAEWAWARAPL